MKKKYIEKILTRMKCHDGKKKKVNKKMLGGVKTSRECFHGMKYSERKRTFIS